MSTFQGALPTSLTIRGKDYPIHTDYRTWTQFEQIMLGTGQSDQEKLKQVLLLVFIDPMLLPDNSGQELLDALIWFYQGGDKKLNRYQQARISRMQSENDERREKGLPPKREAQYYDYDYDADLIVSAFLQQYNIELGADSDLHWWRFHALFSGLMEDTLFAKVLGYRAIKISKDMTDSQKKFYKKMKEVYALPVADEEAKRASALEEALIKGDAKALAELLRGSGSNSNT
ncbi:MAG: bacteriophage Gp15 family protein [Oscillospiraceae bacterium]|nr:bacteriophage Gp15 family protein [Oscillospiraceae bacterium]